MKPRSLFILLYSILLHPITAYTQSSSDKKSSFEGYFDKDKKLDRITVSESNGSGGASFTVVCKFSTQRKRIKFSCDYSFSEFLFVAPIPAVVVDRKTFADELAHKLAPQSFNDTANAGLKWILQVCDNGKSGNEEFTDYTSSFSFIPQKKFPDFYKASYTVLAADSIKRILSGLTYDNTVNPDYYLTFYMGNNHQQIASTRSIEGHSFTVTKHGVLFWKDSGYVWIFINENSIFQAGPEKLRWASIKNIQLRREYLIIKTYAAPFGPEKTFVADLKRGRLFRLKANDDTFINRFMSEGVPN